MIDDEEIDWTGCSDDDREHYEDMQRLEKISAAAALIGRCGGLKGGPARARVLSAQRRREIASNAARVRWHGSIS